MSSPDTSAPPTPQILAPAMEWVEAYFARLSARPLAPVAPAASDTSSTPRLLADAPAPFSALLDRLDAELLPGIVHWNHPGFMAWFNSSSTPAGVAGHALMAALNVNTMMSASAPSAVAFEEALAAELLAALGLDPPMRGVFTGGGSESTLLALAAARARAGGDRVRGRGLREGPPLEIFITAETHSSVAKAALVLGLGLDALVPVATDENGAMDPAALRDALSHRRLAGARAMAVVATIGTTSTTACDPLEAVADQCARRGVWLHVDAAHAGAIALLPERRSDFAGLDRADSVVVNPHKWMFSPLGCSLLALRDPAVLGQALAVRPEYLSMAESELEPMDLGFALGRPFRALPLWLTLATEGLDGIRGRIRHHLALARRFATFVNRTPGLELLGDPPFSTVCFRVSHDGPEGAGTSALLDAVNRSGRVFLSGTRFRERTWARAVFSGYRAGDASVDALESVLTSYLTSAPEPSGATTTT